MSSEDLNLDLTFGLDFWLRWTIFNLPLACQVLSSLAPWQHPVLILKDIKYEELSGIVEFIYHGEVSIDQDCLAGFLQAAETLGIQGLTEDKKYKVKSNQDKAKESPTVANVKKFEPEKNEVEEEYMECPNGFIKEEGIKEELKEEKEIGRAHV